MDVNVHHSVEDRLHELVGEGAEVVVVELDPLEAVEVLEGGSRDLLDAGMKHQTVSQSEFGMLRDSVLTSTFRTDFSRQSCVRKCLFERRGNLFLVSQLGVWLCWLFSLFSFPRIRQVKSH